MKKSEMKERILVDLANRLYYRGEKTLAIISAVGFAMAAIMCSVWERKSAKVCNDLAAKYDNGEYEPDNEE